VEDVTAEAVVRTVRVLIFSEGASVGFSECVAFRRAESAKQRACRICFESECELLDACACRGTMRYICKECLSAEWSMRCKDNLDSGNAALYCGLCNQRFTGKAAQILVGNLQSTVQRRTEAVPQPDHTEQTARYKAQMTNATELWRQGKMTEASALFRTTISGLKTLKGPMDPLVLSCQHNLSLILREQGSLKEAEALVRMARLGFSELFGPEHPLSLKACHNEAMIAQTAGALDKARDGYQAVLEKRKKLLGPEHLDTLKTASNLGLVLHAKGRTAEAEQLFRVTLQGLEHVVGRRHHLALVVLQNLSLVLAMRDPMPLEAEELASEAVLGKQRILGADHPETLEGLRDYASVLTRNGRRKEAEDALRQSLAGMQRCFGFSHHKTEAIMQQLQTLLRDAGETAALGKLIEEQQRKAPVSGVKQLPNPPPEGTLVLVITSIYILPGRRRRGLGRAAVEHWKALGSELRAEALEAWLSVGACANSTDGTAPSAAAGAVSFFQRCGLFSAAAPLASANQGVGGDKQPKPVSAAACAAADDVQVQRLRFSF